MFYLKEDADNGDIIGQLEVEITKDDNARSLYNKVLKAHARLVEEYFPLIKEGKAPRIKQDEPKASYWTKRVPADGIIDWDTCAYNLYDWVRALSEPYPGAFTFYGEKKLFVWASSVADTFYKQGMNGELVEIDREGLLVSTGEGMLKLTCVQIEGEEILTGSEINKSGVFQVGKRLG